MGVWEIICIIIGFTSNWTKAFFIWIGGYALFFVTLWLLLTQNS